MSRRRRTQRAVRALRKQIEAELTREIKKQQIQNSLLKHQSVLVEDHSRQIALLAPRGVGKTWGLIAAAVITCLSGGDVAFVSKTLGNARDSAWKTLLKLAKLHEIDLTKVNHTDLRCEIAGSQLKCFGADNKYLKDNIRGSRWKLIIVDEAGHYFSDLNRLVREVLLPATFARQGTLILSGTPAYIPTGMFYDITTKDTGGAWSVYKFNDPFANPDSIQDAYDQMESWRQEFGEEWDKIPWIRREFFGEWTSDVGKLVYKYRENKNTYANNPPKNEEDRWIAGLDFSFTGNTGWVETLHNPQRHKAIFVMAAKAIPGIGLDQIDKLGPLLNDWHQRSNGGYIAYDSAQEFVAQKLRQTFPHLRLVQAEKTNKYQHIELFNSDLQSSRILIQPDTCGDLIQEWLHGDWKYNSDGTLSAGEPKQNPNRKWDVSDAALYAWRFARNRYWHKENKPPKFGTKEWYEKEEKDILDQLIIQSYMEGQ